MWSTRMLVVIFALLLSACANVSQAEKPREVNLRDPVEVIMLQTINMVRIYEGPDKVSMLRHALQRIGEARKLYIAKENKNIAQGEEIDRFEHTLLASLHIIFLGKYKEMGDLPKTQKELVIVCRHATRSFMPPETWKEACEKILMNLQS